MKKMTLPEMNLALPPGVPLPTSEPLVTKDRIDIGINSDVMLIMKREFLTFTDLFLLSAMYDEAIGLLDIYDNRSKNVRAMEVDYPRLEIHGLIRQSPEDTNRYYELTDKGKTVVAEIREQSAPKEDPDPSFKQLASDFLLLFPKIKLPSGSYARVSSIEIEKKLRNFFNTYKAMFRKEHGFKLTAEDILQATKSYVSRFEKNQYMYMANSSYFIQKRDKSALADELIAIKNGVSSSSVDKHTKRL